MTYIYYIISPNTKFQALVPFLVFRGEAAAIIAQYPDRYRMHP